MADKRINALTTTSASVGDDYFAIDGATNGTRALSAFSPTFGGNINATGTAQAGGFHVPGNGASKPAGTDSYLAATATTSIPLYVSGFTGGGQSADILRVSLNSSSDWFAVKGNGQVTCLATTASTTTSSGALVVGNGTSGGLGVGGNITLGGGVNIAGVASDPLPAGTSGIWTLSGSGLRINSAGVTFASLTGTTLGTATVTVNGTTASSAYNIGALVVSGGVGVGNEVSVYGRVRAQLGLHADSNVPTGLAAAYQVDVQALTTRDILSFGDGARAGLIRGYHDGSGVVQFRFGRYTASSFEEQMRLSGTSATSSSLTIYGTTASTSTSSGALVVSGGVGVAGKVTSTALGLANTSQSIPAWGDVGAQLSVAGAVITDTTSSGTVSRFVSNSIAASSIAASSPTTYTQAATLFIAAGPTANTNVTITNSYALFIAGGRINFGGLPTSSAGLQAGTLWNDAGTLKVA